MVILFPFQTNVSNLNKGSPIKRLFSWFKKVPTKTMVAFAMLQKIDCDFLLSGATKR
jgi:hypothetical protein